MQGVTPMYNVIFVPTIFIHLRVGMWKTSLQGFVIPQTLFMHERHRIRLSRSLGKPVRHELSQCVGASSTRLKPK